MASENTGLIYIEPTADEIMLYRELMEKQGSEIYQHQLDIVTIAKTSVNVLFGFISIANNDQLDGYILCSYHPYISDEWNIELVCSRKDKRLGKVLMNAIEEKAISNPSIKKLTLYCLADEKFKRWYESLGFIYVRTINLRSDIPKVFYMIKNMS